MSGKRRETDYCAVAGCCRVGVHELEHGGYVCAAHRERLLTGNPAMGVEIKARLTPGEKLMDAMIRVVEADDARAELRKAMHAVVKAPDGTEAGDWSGVEAADEEFRKLWHRALEAFRDYVIALG